MFDFKNDPLAKALANGLMNKKPKFEDDFLIESLEDNDGYGFRGTLKTDGKLNSKSIDSHAALAHDKLKSKIKGSESKHISNMLKSPVGRHLADSYLSHLQKGKAGHEAMDHAIGSIGKDAFWHKNYENTKKNAHLYEDSSTNDVEE